MRADGGEDSTVAGRLLPYRGRFGDPRPDGLARLALPPKPMPARLGLRPLKAWRYVGAFSPELMLCVASVRLARTHQSFWAVWDRRSKQLYEGFTFGGSVVLGPASTEISRARVLTSVVAIDLELREQAGVEAVWEHGGGYLWTRKQGGVPAHGTVVLRGRVLRLDCRGVIDDTAGYHARHTRWRWSAGVGTALDGRPVSWNLVEGLDDPPDASERTVWIDGVPFEPPPCRFAPGLAGVDALRFMPEATYQRRQNLVVVRSDYRQPFGTFQGELPSGIVLSEGYGVMEEHEAWW